MEAVMFNMNELKKKHPGMVKETPMAVAALLYILVFVLHA